MRRAGYALFVAAILLAALRCWTAIVYRADEPVAAFVLKRRPSLVAERTETAAEPIGRDIVLDQEEPRLFYGHLYLGAMGSVPLLVPLMIAGGVILLARGRRT